MTLIGLLFFIAIVISFKYPIKYSVAILLVSTVFSASSVLNIAGKSIIPYLLCSLFVCIRILFYQKSRIIIRREIWSPAIFFVIYASLITILGPILFEGMEVVGSNLDESWWEGYDKLAFSIGNIAQIIYLVINFSTILFLLSLKNEISTDFLRNTFLLVVEISLFFGFWEFISKVAGVIPFPSSVLLNNVGQGLDGELRTTGVLGTMRMSSLYSEASYFGAFLGAAFWSLLFLPKSKRRNIDIIVAAIALLLNMSGTGVVTFIGGSILYLMFNSNHIRTIFFLFFSAFVLLFILSQFEFSEIFYNMLSGKADSASGQVRIGTTMKNLEIFVDSFFLGIGRGSTRSSSFIIDMLASVGLLGSSMFMIFYYRLIKEKWKIESVQYICIYCWALLIGQVVAIPDFSFSAMWFGLYMAACVNVQKNGKLCYI